MGKVEGKAAAALQAADTAFKRGDYDRAVAQAQAALGADPGNSSAQNVLENAVGGQKAALRFRSAESALSRKDFAAAMTETEAGRQAAPWDARGPSLIQRIQVERQRAEQEADRQADLEQRRQADLKRSAQVNDLLTKADEALSAQKYDASISLFDSVLTLDQQNQRAILGKSSAVQARALAQAAQAQSLGGVRPSVGKAFVPGKTQARSPETAPTGGIPGFEESAGVTVKKGTQAADLPGKINFEIEPDTVKPGDRYTVKITLLNEGNAPIQVRDMMVATTANGRTARGPVTPQVKEVAPRQRAVLRELPDIWKEETTSWAMEVTVRTERGETYTNQVTWR
jgi:tetratricopeptide (TPR) repeat protein